MTKTELRNKYLKYDIVEARLAFVKQRNYYACLLRKSKRNHYSNLNVKDIRDHSFNTYAKCSEKLTSCTGVRNVNFSKDFAYVLNQ